MKRQLKQALLAGQKFLYQLTPHKFPPYQGDLGFFLKSHPQSFAYRYANWGSRRWEYPYIATMLNAIGLKDKQVVDIGIGLPGDADFYKFYVASGCYLTAYDPDSRLPEVTQLSPRCRILRKSGGAMTELADSSVDVVVVLSAFEHFPLPAFQKTVQEIFRVLKPGGHFLVTLDLTFDKRRSARWAILEKTLNGLPAEENDLPLTDKYQQITVEKFLEFLEPNFIVSDRHIYNAELPLSQHVVSKKWNSHVAYLHLTSAKK